MKEKDNKSSMVTRFTRRDFIRQVATATLEVAGATNSLRADDSRTETNKLTDPDVLALAAEGIEKHRKGAGSLVFEQPGGTPLQNARVTLKQRTHDFLFGNYIRPHHYSDRAYLDRFRELFNFVQLLEFNWGQYESDEGKPLRRQRMEFINNWCRKNGLTRFYGHMLVWTSQYGEYPRSGLLLWLFNYDKARQYQLLKQRVQREVADYRDIDIIWDVVNEPVHCRVWGDWDKDSYIQNSKPEQLDRVGGYVEDALGWAHEANPGASLMINDYATLIEGRFQDRFRELIDELLVRRAPLNAIGIQAHEPYKGTYWYSPVEIWSAYERLGTATGLPIFITELLFVSDTTKSIRGNYRSGNWNGRLQAEAVEQFYRVSFGHPFIQAITYFGLSDREVWQPKCGLLDESYEPKPAWDLLKRLIQEEWTTEFSGDLSPDGTLEFKGFFGRYEVEIATQSFRRAYEIHLQKHGPNRWKFTV